MAWEKITGLASDGQYDFYFIPGRKDKAYAIGATDGVAYTRLFRSKGCRGWGVWPIESFRPLIPHLQKKTGYLYVHLRLDSGPKRRTLHGLVMEAVHGKCPPGQEVRHFPDSDKTNNKIENLIHGTSQQNHDDMKIQGLYINGENHPLTLYGDDWCMKIFSMRADGAGQEEISQALGMSKIQVNRIFNGRIRPYLRERWLKENAEV